MSRRHVFRPAAVHEIVVEDRLAGSVGLGAKSANRHRQIGIDRAGQSARFEKQQFVFFAVVAQQGDIARSRSGHRPRRVEDMARRGGEIAALQHGLRAVEQRLLDFCFAGQLAHQPFPALLRLLALGDVARRCPDVFQASAGAAHGVGAQFDGKNRSILADIFLFVEPGLPALEQALSPSLAVVPCVPAFGSDRKNVAFAQFGERIAKHVAKGLVGVEDAAVRIGHDISIAAAFEYLAIAPLRLGEPVGDFDLVQGVSQIARQLVEKTDLIGVKGAGKGRRNAQNAIGPAAERQSMAHGPPSAIRIRKNASRAIRLGIGQDALRRSRRRNRVCLPALRTCSFQSPPHARRKNARFERNAHRRESAAESRFGRRRGLPARFVQQGDPGAAIAHGFGQILARALNQPDAVVFLGDDLIDVANGAKDGVEAIGMRAALLQFADLAFDPLPRVMKLGDFADDEHPFGAGLAGAAREPGGPRPRFDLGGKNTAAPAPHAHEEMLAGSVA
ncbi:MAG: hypothetical protein BWZ10_01966 [candidate division BRC1 bacterium ADurb.BinA364]|nr:MAG: hypothetical protein BWZ10_01966 [candidate division BRC1 bacterium ADurb.BinA364]